MSMPVGGATPPERARVRRCVLAASVLFDIDLLPADDGFVLPGVPEVFVGDDELAIAIGDRVPESAVAQRALARWLRIRRALAERSLDELAENIRPVGLPVGHELHEGPRWVRDPVLGGCLDVGPGFVALDDADRDRVVVVPQSALDAAGIDITPWWRGACEYLENMGALATARWRREPKLPLRPMGDCDVATLLASTVLRGALASPSDGMRAIAVPVRHRGWLDLSRIDPAFAQAAASIAGDEERAFPRPLLLTLDEVVMVKPGGDAATIVLRDPAPAQARWLRDVLYH
jgi:hypothetical protein